MKKKLIFVYNANTGFLNKTLDSVHKIISPETYSCGLCRLTYGSFSENKLWKNFRKKEICDFVFLYKDQFVDTYGSDLIEVRESGFPVVFEKTNDKLKVFMDTKRLAEITSVQELIGVIMKKLN